jgi:hypothetical protein
VKSVISALVVAAVLLVCCAVPRPVDAAAPAAGLTVDSLSLPTNFSAAQNANCVAQAPGTTEPPAYCDEYEFTVRNAGSIATDGSEMTLTGTIEAGLNIQKVYFHWSKTGNVNLGEGLCDVASSTVECHFPEHLAPDDTLTVYVLVTVEPGAPEHLHSSWKVSGGDVAAQSSEVDNIVSSSPASFGPARFAVRDNGLNGMPDTQAGDHPYELQTTIGLNSDFRLGGPVELKERGATSVEDPRDFVVDLPLGLVGSTLAAPECAETQAASGSCPEETIVGHIKTHPEGIDTIDSPIWNLVPEQGVPAEFGYRDQVGGSHVFYVHVVPTPAGYVLQTVNPETPAIPLANVEVTFYGDPAAKEEERTGHPTTRLDVPFFTNPTGCGGEEPTATLYVDSWQHPAKIGPDGTPANLEEPAWKKAVSKLPPMIGCDALSFTPELAAQPTTHEADKPSGLNFELRQPQTEKAGVPATATLKRAVVSFPEGFTVDPAAGDGLEVCSEAQIGWIGPSHMNFNAAAPACPEASKIGTLELETPLIAHKLEGELYLAAQNQNPFGSTLGLYVVVDDPITGVLVKIAGKAMTDPHTGRLTAGFDENPNLPFSALKLHFFGGPRAEFATPEACGTFATTTELFPYSFPDSGMTPATPFDSYLIDEQCPGGFSPSFAAGSTNLQAGAFTPFVVSFSRSDADQELSGLSVTLPPGLIGKIAGIPLCGEVEANAGSCPESSMVGTVKAGAGPGPDPLFVTGKAYLTGPYDGGPYGLSVVVPAVAGPFDFGTVVVRQSIRINPITAQVTDVSDPFPKIIDGIPLRLRRIDVELSRPGFTFNPTSCEHMGFNGTIAGSPLGAPTTLNGTVGYASEAGSTAAVAAPFQVTDCAALKFDPSMSVATAGKASKANGASLSFKIAYPAGAMGSQSWFREAKFTLPKQLPTRLATIQKACLAATFETDREACPAASKIGTAIVHTPVLPAALEGPVYFVSYGGAAWPDAVLVLKGDGVTVQLKGETFIDNKTGVTSATFRGTPDVPFESIEVSLPTGPFSEFGTNLPAKDNYNLCGQKLIVPTFFKAQNGLELHQNTTVTVTGCTKPKTLTRAQRLAGALRACHNKHAKRAACEHAARRKFGKVARKSSAAKTSKATGRK